MEFRLPNPPSTERSSMKSPFKRPATPHPCTKTESGMEARPLVICNTFDVKTVTVWIALFYTVLLFCFSFSSLEVNSESVHSLKTLFVIPLSFPVFLTFISLRKEKAMFLLPTLVIQALFSFSLGLSWMHGIYSEYERVHQTTNGPVRLALLSAFACTMSYVLSYITYVLLLCYTHFKAKEFNFPFSPVNEDIVVFEKLPSTAPSVHFNDSLDFFG